MIFIKNLSNMAKIKGYKIKGYNLRGGHSIGAWYVRNKRTDKWGNKYQSSPTLRNVHSGLVVSNRGKVLGTETNIHHNYGSDPRRRKLTIVQTKQQKAIMRNLRMRGLAR